MSVVLCREAGCYQMGQVMTVSWRVRRPGSERLSGLEASVLWFTEGKGDVDLQVHSFHQWSESDLRQLDLSIWHSFRCELPLSPLSYEGTLLRINWCVRMRLFCEGSKEIVVQTPFRLTSGQVPGVLGSCAPVGKGDVELILAPGGLNS